MQPKTLLSTLGAATLVAGQFAAPHISHAGAGAPAAGVVTYTTIVDSFTTVCAETTTITHSDVCYTATRAGQTLTITNCPCTITTTSAAGAATATHAAVPTYVTAGVQKQAALGVGALAAGAAAVLAAAV